MDGRSTREAVIGVAGVVLLLAKASTLALAAAMGKVAQDRFGWAGLVGVAVAVALFAVFGVTAIARAWLWRRMRRAGTPESVIERIEAEGRERRRYAVPLLRCGAQTLLAGAIGGAVLRHWGWAALVSAALAAGWALGFIDRLFARALVEGASRDGVELDANPAEVIGLVRRVDDEIHGKAD